MKKLSMAVAAAASAALLVSCSGDTGEKTPDTSSNTPSRLSPGEPLPEVNVAALGKAWSTSKQEAPVAKVCSQPMLPKASEETSAVVADADGRTASIHYLRVSGAERAVKGLKEAVENCGAHLTGSDMHYAWTATTMVDKAMNAYLTAENLDSGDQLSSMGFAAVATAPDTVAYVVMSAADGYEVSNGEMPYYVDSVLRNVAVAGVGGSPDPVVAYDDIVVGDDEDEGNEKPPLVWAD